MYSDKVQHQPLSPTDLEQGESKTYTTLETVTKPCSLQSDPSRTFGHYNWDDLDLLEQLLLPETQRGNGFIAHINK